MWTRAIGFLILLPLAGCGSGHKTCQYEISSCEDVRLEAVIRCHMEGQQVFATLFITNKGDRDINLHKYQVMQTHEDAAPSFDVSKAGKETPYHGTQYHYDEEFRDKCITIGARQTLEARWRLDKSFEFSANGLYDIHFSRLLSFGSRLCEISSPPCQLNYQADDGGS
jgi:hypothetical protein